MTHFGAERGLDELLLLARAEHGDIAGYLDVGSDVLGETFMRQRPLAERRLTGSVYTPASLVAAMISLVSDYLPDTVIDCGCGSGRFALAAARAFPQARIIAVDNSPLACEMCSANVKAAGFESRIEVVCSDFLDFSLPGKGRGSVLWIGNPPYVRHHGLCDQTKKWLKGTAQDLGFKASGLSGLHVCFLAKIASLWQTGDRGVLVTSAEWLDVNYGSFVRDLLVRKLGLDSLMLFDKESRVFESADATAVVFSFGLHCQRVAFSCPEWSGTVGLEELSASERWSEFAGGANGQGVRQSVGSETLSSTIPLGELAAVHRGVVTGNNRFWVRSVSDLHDVPESLTIPIVAHAREITGECIAQNDPSSLGRIIALPENLESLGDEEREAARCLIEDGLEKGVNTGYVASRRRPWWSIKLPEAPPIMMTYMSRKSPTFVVNVRGLPMLNVVHGIYPKQPMSSKALHRLVGYLNENVDKQIGRTYCGGLTKFEPKEAEALRVPPLEVLEA